MTEQLSGQRVEVVVNGEVLAVTAHATVSAVLQQIECPARGVAVALNGEVVPRTEWVARSLSAGDRLEILAAAQGG